MENEADVFYVPSDKVEDLTVKARYHLLDKKYHISDIIYPISHHISHEELCFEVSIFI